MSTGHHVSIDLQEMLLRQDKRCTFPAPIFVAAGETITVELQPPTMLDEVLAELVREKTPHKMNLTKKIGDAAMARIRRENKNHTCPECNKTGEHTATCQLGKDRLEARIRFYERLEENRKQ